MNRRLERLIPMMLSLALAACASAPAEKPSEADTATQAEQAATAPVTSVEDGLMRGDEAWRRGDLDLALYLFVQGLQVDARNAQLLAKIGAIHESRNNLPLARRAFELAHEYDPDDARLSERLGLILISQGDKTAALEAFRAADRTTPGRWRTLDGLGQLALERGELQRAFDYFERARIASPRTAAVVLHRGETYLIMGNNEAAERDARSALALGGQSLPGAWRCLGTAQANMKRYDEALQSFLHVDNLAAAYNAVGEAAMKNSDHLVAREYLQNAAHVSPVYFETAYRNLALVGEKLRQKPSMSGS